MNYKLALHVLIVSYLFNIGFSNACKGQESERDPGQASALLQGVVTDEQGTPVIVNRLATIEQIEADTESLTFILVPAASLKGSVKDEDGNPVKGVDMTARSNAIGQTYLTAQTDAVGNFSFPAVTTKMIWSVYASTEANSQSKDVDVQEAKEFKIEDFVVKSKR